MCGSVPTNQPGGMLCFLARKRREEGRDVVRLTEGGNADVDLDEWLLASLARKETWTAVY